MKNVYQIEIHPSANKELQRLPEKIALKIGAALELISTDPYKYGKKLSAHFEGQYSYRVWPYRIIFEILQDRIVVIILKILHRKDAYK
ncbi:type II toxin-antitoxin system RelE/ParE family toxin [Candidatus Falkowbacteria bacterium]|nr:type II toxin-antitoxin system RelE/ParE family toxin [Candidatus Falkowbacteria bacterium]